MLSTASSWAKYAFAVAIVTLGVLSMVWLVHNHKIIVK
jgi:hypothetical protein